MSDFDQIAANHADELVEHLGDRQAAWYIPPEGEPVLWDCVIGSERGDEEFSPSGDLVKIIRLTLTGPAQTLIDNGVTQLQMRAKVQVGGQSWSVELRESRWSDSLVQIGLKRKPIVEHEQLENAALRS